MCTLQETPSGLELVELSDDGATPSEDTFKTECDKSKQLLGMLMTLVASEVTDLQAVSRWMEVHH